MERNYDNTVNFVYQVKNGRKWETTFECAEPVQVYRWLEDELIAKFINKCTYIRSIRRSNLYNGYQRITVYYYPEFGKSAMRIYTVPQD